MTKNLLICILLISSITLKAQTRVGVKMGVNSSNHSYKNEGSDLYPTNYLIGYQVGLWMSNTISDKFDLISEMTYAKEGFKFDTGDSVNYKTRINFLSVSTSINYTIGQHFTMGIGPEVARNVNSKWIINGNKVDIDEYRKYSYGWNFNFGYKFKMPLGVGVRYHQGINDIGKTITIFTDSNGKITDVVKYDEIKRNFQVNVYYQF